MGDCILISVERTMTNRTLEQQGRPGTDIVFYSVNPSTKRICTTNMFRALFSPPSVGQLRGDLSGWFQLVTVTNDEAVIAASASGNANYGNVDGNTISTAGNTWGTLPIAFIVLACLVAAGALIAIISLCCFWSRYKSSKQVMTMPSHLYGPTPMFMPPDKMYETQMLEMAMNDESNGSDELSRDDGIYTVSSPNGMHGGYGRPAPANIIPPPDYPPTGTNNGRYNRRNGVAPKYNTNSKSML